MQKTEVGSWLKGWPCATILTPSPKADPSLLPLLPPTEMLAEGMQPGACPGFSRRFWLAGGRRQEQQIPLAGGLSAHSLQTVGLQKSL